MRKSFFACLLLIVCSFVCKAQGAGSLAGARWTGTMYVPDPLACLFSFGKDTARIIYVGSNEITINQGGAPYSVSGKDSAALETMIYTYHGDTLAMWKVSGGSPCDDGKGEYRVQRQDGKIKLQLIKDACGVRPYALKEELKELK